MKLFVFERPAFPSDPRRFEAIYLAYRKQMFLVARSILPNDADAEDAVHDVFTRIAAKHLHTVCAIRSENDLRNYLLKAAKNTALNRLDKDRRLLSLDTFEEWDPGAALSDEDFLDSVCRRMDYRQVLEAIRSLDVTYRDVLYYHFVLEMSVPEVAQSLDRKEETVKKQLVRGKKLLLDRLARIGGTSHGH